MQINPAAYRPGLATSAHNLAIRSSVLERYDEALFSAEDAVRIRRQLAQANPAAHLLDLANSTDILALLQWKLGRSHEALATALDALELWKALDEQRPNRYIHEREATQQLIERLSSND